MSGPATEPSSVETSSCLVKHGAFLDALRDGPAHKQALADDLDVSPETVYRKARRLSEHGLVERGPDGYRLTNVGLLHAELGADVRTLSARIHAAGRLLTDVPGAELPPYTVLRGATVTRSDPAAPNHLGERVRSFLDDAGALDGMVTAAVPEFVEALAGRAEAGRPATGVVVSTDVAPYFERNHTDAYERLTGAENVTFGCLDDVVPYSLFVDGERASAMLLVTHGRMGGICGTIRNDSVAAVDWAERTVRARQERATRIG